MSIEDALAGASAKPAGKRPYFFVKDVERVLAITMAVAQELAVTRERLDTVERLLREKNVLRLDEIETFAPNADDTAARSLWTQEYLTRILRIVQQEGEAVLHAGRGDVASEDVASELSCED